MFDTNQKCQDLTFVAFDSETTGKYPLESEICEVAAVKWSNGQILDRFQSLVKPMRAMSEEVIKIHNITNEMVATAPRIEDVIPGLAQFMRGTILVAHHAPFDLGFLVPEYEKLKISLPPEPVICTSLLSRKVIKESSNHKLQTLIRLLKLDGGQAHRALDDANACMLVAQECFRRLGADCTLEKAIQLQGQKLLWADYSLDSLLEHSKFQHLIRAIKDQKAVDLVYEGGSRPGKSRVVEPIGLVRNPQGDFLVATEDGEWPPKRYLLEKISDAKIRSRP